MAIANHDNYDVFEALFFKNDVFYSIFDTLDFFAFQICRILQYIWHTGIFRPTVDHDNYDVFEKSAVGTYVNYDILKIEALGYHDNYDVFEKYFSKTMYFPMYLTHWNFSRFKYVVFYTNLDTRTGENDSRPVNYDIL